MQLDGFLTEHRLEIIARCQTKVAARCQPRPDDADRLERAIPQFLDQVIDTLRQHLSNNPDAIGSATQHGRDLMNGGFTVAQVVHAYGDVCQSVTDLAVERGAPITSEDFRTLNACLDDAIADAVTEFSLARDRRRDNENNERLGVAMHEIRNLIGSAMLTFGALKLGRVGIAGSTGAVLERSLLRLASLVERSLAHVRLEAGNLKLERVEVGRFFEEIEIAASLSARAKGIEVSVALPNEAGLAVEADPELLSAIVVNLVQNAVKFTRPDGHVGLSVRATDDRVLLDVTDECGGLPPGKAESLFRPFAQGGADRSGVGLGLTIARRGAEAQGGQIHVRDVPGTGCVFTVELPRSL
jgi:signal transduction histidine kinase